MQHSPTEIKEKLLKAVDKEYNVLDMGAVVEVISILERTPITKEALESTRLGKYVNELRRKTTNESLAKRAKDLVRQWRHLISPIESCPAGSVPREVSSVNHQKNGLNVTSRLGGTLSPGLLSRDTNLSPGLPQNNSPVVSPYYPVVGGSVANSRILSVSPAVSLASSEKSNTSPSLLQSSSSVSRVVKHATCPRTPPISQNSQTKTLRGHRPESPNPIQTNVNLVLASESVPKTHVANKRLRKDSPTSDEDVVKKIARPNGDICNTVIDVVGDCSRDSFGGNSEHESLSWDIHIPPKIEVPKDSGLDNKKRGHKRVLFKGHKVKVASGDHSSSTTLPSSDDIVKEKIASIARISKVKTTQELLAGLQAKNVLSSSPEKLQSKNFLPTENKPSLANCVLPSSRGSPSDALEISRNKSEHIEKFLRSQSGIDVNSTVPEPGRSLKYTAVGDSLDSADVATKEVKDSTLSSSNVIYCSEPPISLKDSRVPVVTDDSADKIIDNIMGRLPPIDYNSLAWDEPVEHPQSLVVFDSDALGKLSTEHIEGVNGNFSHIKTSDDVPKFCEWHEPVSRTSYGGELLAVLPYVIID
ncbi:uncharacterized protein [Anabrus simplex]|uniref:uncharacterized protein isoform X2 n=1 Tax=Anabrus simplex TaxID=316456 RepID=UPI0034DDC5DA